MNAVQTAGVIGRVLLRDWRSRYQALSERGSWVHNFAEPLAVWWGHNPRVLTGACRSSVSVRDPTTSSDPRAESEGDPVRSSVVVNGASHNYAGFYAPTPLSEELHRACLDGLPLADESAVPALNEAACTAIATFFRADFCVCTSTGYGSNYVALPAVIRFLAAECSAGVAVILDDKCHNSMLTGIFLAKPTVVRKFRHNDMNHLETLLEELTGKHDHILVAIEGIYRSVSWLGYSVDEQTDRVRRAAWRASCRRLPIFESSSVNMDSCYSATKRTHLYPSDGQDGAVSNSGTNSSLEIRCPMISLTSAPRRSRKRSAA